MPAFRAGDFCSKGGDKDQGDLGLWLRQHFPVWSPQCGGGNGEIGRAGGGFPVGHHKHSVLTAIVIFFCFATIYLWLVKNNGKLIVIIISNKRSS